MAWQFTSDRPIYVQMSDQIVAGILSGTYQLGEKLPSVREFAIMASVNPNTVQRALFELENIGLIETQRNTGKFVTSEDRLVEMARTKRGEALVADFLKNMADLGYSVEQTLGLLETAKKGGSGNERSNA